MEIAVRPQHFLQKKLDRFRECGYFAVTSDIGLPDGGFPLSEEQMKRHEDKSQDGTMPRRLGLAVCYFARS